MKNVIKMLSMMLIAGTIMVSCTEKPNTPTHQTPTYTITVTANNDAYGTVSGGGVYDSAATATLTATANEGYHFVNWADGNGNNPRIITVTADASYMANFAENSGVNVTFGSAQWNAQYVNATCAPTQSGYAVNVAAAQNNANSYPIMNLYCAWSGEPTNGTINDGPRMEEGQNNTVSIIFGQQAYLWYYESGSWNLSGGNGTIATGDWWAKSLTINVTAIDIQAMTMSAVINADMAHVTEMVNEQGQLTTIDFNDVSSRNLTANIVNQSLTAEKKALNVTKKAVVRMAK